MLALRFSPYEQLRNLDRAQHRPGRPRGEFAPTGSPAVNPGTFPALDAWEDEPHFYVEAELRGLALDDLEIYVSDENVLTIKGLRKAPEGQRGTWHRRERPCGAFERTFALPGPVDAEHVEATLKQGILAIKLPKAERIRPRKIAAKS